MLKEGLYKVITKELEEIFETEDNSMFFNKEEKTEDYDYDYELEQFMEEHSLRLDSFLENYTGRSFLDNAVGNPFLLRFLDTEEKKNEVLQTLKDKEIPFFTNNEVYNFMEYIENEEELKRVKEELLEDSTHEVNVETYKHLLKCMHLLKKENIKEMYATILDEGAGFPNIELYQLKSGEVIFFAYSV